MQYALADDAQIPGLNRLRESQSIFFAITEVCKGKPGSYKPPARPSPGCEAASSSPTSDRPEAATLLRIGSASTPMEAELIRRDEELQRVQRFLEAVPASGRALLIAGEAGVGKTSVAGGGGPRAGGPGMRVIAARPAEAETSFAHAALGDLLGPHPGYWRTSRPGAARSK